MLSSFNQHFHTRRSRGFTLIELLVSVTIIVLILSVGFVAFGTARERADDNDAKQILGLMRVEAERIYAETRTFPGCNDNRIAAISSSLPSTVTLNCQVGTRGYAFEIELSNGEFFCTDVGGAKEESSTSLINSNGSCN